jgi:DNA-binding response OmpR family regulator
MKVLIVSSDLDHQKMTRFLLEESGYHVVQTTSAKKTLGMLKTGRLDLVLLDSECEGGGYLACREIRFRSAIPIIFVARANTAADRTRGLKLGGDDYLCKPYYPPELLARIGAVMRRCAAWLHSGRRAPEAGFASSSS